jgi:hypothetical protein
MNNLDKVVKYIEYTNEFITTLLNNHKMVERLEGRRFDRIKCDNKVLFFIDKVTWDIYGAKSSFQHNSRRVYGTIDINSQWDWKTLQPITGTAAEKFHGERESAISKNYKKRGRPRKLVETTDEE